MNISNDSDLRNLSIHILTVIAPWNITLIFVCTAQLISGLLIFTSILSSVSLRQNQTFVILANVSGSDSVYSLCSLITCIDRFYHFMTNIPSSSTIRLCLLRDIVRYTAYANSNGFLLLLALNRLLAVAAPIWYQKWTCRRFFHVLIFATYGRSLIFTFLIIFAPTDDPVPVCGYLPLKTELTNFFSGMAITWTVAIAITYAAAVAIMYARLASVKRKQGDVDEARKNLQVQVVWTLASILIIHVSTTVIGNVAAVFAAMVRFWDDQERNYVGLICSGFFISSSTVLYFPVLYARCEEFRTAARRILRVTKENRVGVVKPENRWAVLRRGTLEVLRVT